MMASSTYDVTVAATSSAWTKFDGSLKYQRVNQNKNSIIVQVLNKNCKKLLPKF